MNGSAMLALCEQLFPICRSITGNGVRETLRIIGESIPVQLHEVASGTAVFDWVVPPEWNLRRATLRGPDGAILADTDVHNLHVLNYSTPFRGTVTLDELRRHLFSRPDRPDVIPYRTSYYKPAWGFCLPHRIVESLVEGNYAVDIDTTLAPGSLTYGECLLPGESADEIVLSAHVCHPSLANDNLSGIAVAVAAVRALRGRKRHYTVRVVFAPGTIGAIVWLHRNRANVGRVRHGLILSCLGDDGSMTYKASRKESATIDRVALAVLQARGRPHSVRRFSPYGYDERQYSSPGFDLPFGVLMRTPYGEYDAYHTSADNCSLLDPAALEDSAETVLAIIDSLEGSVRPEGDLVPDPHEDSFVAEDATPPVASPDEGRRFRNLQPYGEPQLGRRGLYATTGGTTKSAGYEMALLWVLNLSDGHHDLRAIAVRSGLPLPTLLEAAAALLGVGLLEEITPGSAADRSGASRR